MSRDIAIVSGYLVRCPLGGYAWQNLHYLLGLRELGFDAYFYEDTEYYADCFEPRTGNQTDDPRAGLEFAGDFFGAHGLGDRWVFNDTWRKRCLGLSAEARDEVIRSARVWISLATVNRLPDVWRGRAGTACIDLDPGYTQIRAAADEDLRRLLTDHRVHFTVGERIGAPDCGVPTAGLEWRPTRQPIVTSLWQPTDPPPDAAYSTIGRWDEQRREVEVAGVRYSWRKRTEWMKLLDLPSRTGERFRVAMDVTKNPEDLARLESHGWEVVDPIAISADASAYRDFIRASKGEFTVSKDVTVRLRTGWFSDRAACYLASGRPVVNQDTNFKAILPVGAGLFAYSTVDDAVSAIAQIGANYEAHRRAAREVAEEHFGASRVLSDLVSQL